MAKMTWQERNAWQEEHTALAQEKFKAVAVLLGWDYSTGDSDSKSATLSKPLSSYAIHCYFKDWKDRLTFMGRFPQRLAQHRIHSGSSMDLECDITVSPGKAPERIVRDLQARLLPNYTALYNELEQRHRKHVKQIDEMDNLAQSIAKHGNGSVSEMHSQRYADKYGMNRRPMAHFGAKVTSGAPYGSAEISSYNKLHATMELRNVPPELAEYIASLLGEWSEE